MTMRFVLALFLGILTMNRGLHAEIDLEPLDRKFYEVEAHTREDRTMIQYLGIDIENIQDKSVWVWANQNEVRNLSAAQFKILNTITIPTDYFSQGRVTALPSLDANFHTYHQMVQSLQRLEAQYPYRAKMVSIGKTIENRDIWALHLNSSPEALKDGFSDKPGAVFMGNHHAREHLSLEIPLMLAEYLLANERADRISKLLDSRDIWIIPTVNPDGAEYDISTGKYRNWRKNRRNNGDGTYGVDLNRNYSYKWGMNGISHDSSSDIYLGEAPFSEPETQSIRDFLTPRKSQIKTMISFHTYSELILYPWGYTYSSISNKDDQKAFEKMAASMAQWNGYKAKASSDLYIAAGDTVDWAYGELGIFGFTFELSPRSFWLGGFYPDSKIIKKVFKQNMEPCLYLIDIADNPYRSLTE